MTREEFIESVDTISQLIDFCNDVGCPVCDQFYTEDSMDDYINECLPEWARDNNWYELRDLLESIPTGFDWYYLDDDGDWLGYYDGNVYDFKEDALDWADRNDAFDPDPEEFDEEELPDPEFQEEDAELEEDPEEEFTPDFSIKELCESSVHVIRAEADLLAALAAEESARQAQAEREEQKEFDDFFRSVLHTVNS